MTKPSFFRLFAVSAVLLSVGWTLPFDDNSLDPSLLKDLNWREIGPAAFGGRIDDIEAVASDPHTIFVAAASGGIFKSTNNGVTWKPVFDEVGEMLSVGDIAIAPSDSNIVWAGSGEPNSRQSSSWGNGVYRSLDGGDHWQYMGLKETHHIGRVVIHPTDPSVVYVAALGHLWGPNPERGLYRTRDAGKSWDKVLSVNDDTGVVDVAIDPNGRILYAATYQRRRRAWGFVGGGPHSGLYRSLDGGDNWEKLSSGLPQGDTGRIGIAIASSRPSTVYAVVENKNGGVFKSEDHGSNWTRVNEMNPRPMYYSQLRVDPRNENKVWLLGSPLFVSIDGGKTFSQEGTGEKIHVDHHALWIDPNDPDHLMLGNDGGLYFSYDGSRNWDFINNLPIAQYYDIGIDTRDPYWIYGGTQDNGTWAIPSRTHSELGITNADVVNVAYGDGFFAVIDPRDHQLVYSESQSGRLYRVDMKTLEEKGIRPVPSAADEEYRFNWSSPLALSPKNPDIVYYGGNKLFRSDDHGHSWKEVSPDLTLNQEWKKLEIMGVERNDDTLSRDDGVSDYGTITTFSESPLKEGLIYVGTDDGNVQVTRDGGKNWTNVTDRFSLPGPRWVTRVLASEHQEATAYATFAGHQDNDFQAYIFKSTDFGQSWQRLGSELPENTVVNAIAEHPRKPEVLFAGAENGLLLSIDGGSSWTPVTGGLPRVPVDDILVNARDNDLILGTHGRGIFILDDLTWLEQLSPSVLQSEVYVFPIREATQAYLKRSLPVPGAAGFSAPNPPVGAVITYYLGTDPPQPEPKDQKAEGNTSTPPKMDDGNKATKMEPETPQVKLVVKDSGGQVVRELKGPDKKGMQRVSWDLRYPLDFKLGDNDEGWFGPATGPNVLPGKYTVTLMARGQEVSQPLTVRLDPQLKRSDADLKARLEATRQTNELIGAFVKASTTVERMEEELKKIQKGVEEKEISDTLKAEIKANAEELEKLKKAFKAGWGGEKFKFLDLMGQLQASTSAPTDSQMRSLEQLDKKLRENVQKVNELATKGMPDLIKQLEGTGIHEISFETVTIP